MSSMNFEVDFPAVIKFTAGNCWYTPQTDVDEGDIIHLKLRLDDTADRYYSEDGTDTPSNTNRVKVKFHGEGYHNRVAARSTSTFTYTGGGYVHLNLLGVYTETYGYYKSFQMQARTKDQSAWASPCLTMKGTLSAANTSIGSWSNSFWTNTFTGNYTPQNPTDFTSDQVETLKTSMSYFLNNNFLRTLTTNGSSVYSLLPRPTATPSTAFSAAFVYDTATYSFQGVTDSLLDGQWAVGEYGDAHMLHGVTSQAMNSTAYLEDVAEGDVPPNESFTFQKIGTDANIYITGVAFDVGSDFEIAVDNWTDKSVINSAGRVSQIRLKAAVKDTPGIYTGWVEVTSDADDATGEDVYKVNLSCEVIAAGGAETSSMFFFYN